MFRQAADWIGLESRKALWGQFWSAHQRFFKYLCVAAKVHRLVELAREELARDKVSWWRSRQLGQWGRWGPGPARCTGPPASCDCSRARGRPVQRTGCGSSRAEAWSESPAGAGPRGRAGTSPEGTGRGPGQRRAGGYGRPEALLAAGCVAGGHGHTGGLEKRADAWLLGWYSGPWASPWAPLEPQDSCLGSPPVPAVRGHRTAVHG